MVALAAGSPFGNSSSFNTSLWKSCAIALLAPSLDAFGLSCSQTKMLAVGPQGECE